MEKISILVPCCNVEKYVRQCLDSIKAQTHTNLEIICIDDGSKDSTGAIIDEYVAADSRFKVIHKPNSGYGDSMNKGLEMCSGDYIGIIESDDWIEPNMFETLLATAKSQNLDLVRCCWYEGPTGTESIKIQNMLAHNVVMKPLEHPEVFQQQPSIWAALYRKDLLEEGRKVRFLPTPGASYQDASFAFKTYTKSQRFMLIDNPLHHYRINPNSSVSASTSKVCSVVDEWEEMLRWVLEGQKLREVFSKSEILAKVCWGGLYWNYNRLSRSSLKLVFLRRASRFFQKASDAGVLPFNHYARKNGRYILEVMKSPLDYHRQLRYGRLKTLEKYKTAKPANGSHQETLISVVVACYNTSAYIESCLTSILQQDYRNIEIICVDDCSIDDTPLLVRHFMRKDKRIRFICTDQNSGLSASRNLGISQCHGEYVMFVDGDDCLLPGAISNLYTAMGEQDDMVVGSVAVEYEEGKGNYGTVVDGDKGYFTIKDDHRFNALTDINAAQNRHVSAWSKLWRMSVLKKYQIAFPVGLYYEDVSFYWKYLLMAPRVHCIKQPVYLYHRHMAGSIMGETFRKKPGMGIHNIYILEDIFKFAESHGKEGFFRKELSGLYEKYFWQAYNSSPKEDYEQVLERTYQVLNQHQVDTSEHPVLQYVSTYHDVPKSVVFMDAYQGSKALGVETSPVTARLSRKLKKYRLLTKIFIYLSVFLLILLVASLLM